MNTSAPGTTPATDVPAPVQPAVPGPHPTVAPPPGQFAPHYASAVDLIAAATKKFSDAGMSGTEAGKLALQLFLGFHD